MKRDKHLNISAQVYNGASPLADRLTNVHAVCICITDWCQVDTRAVAVHC